MTEREIGQILAKLEAIDDKLDKIIMSSVNSCLERWEKHYDAHERISHEITKTQTIFGIIGGIITMLWAGMLIWWKND